MSLLPYIPTVTLAVSLLPQVASAQSPRENEIALCNHTYHLGQSRSQVEGDFASGSCALVPIQTGDQTSPSYMVQKRGDHTVVYGQLSFRGNSLTYAAHDWTDSVQTEADFAKVLIELLHTYDHGGVNSCTMTTTFSSGPDFDRKSAALKCGSKVLDIELVDYKSSKSVQITESLGTS